MAGIGQCSRTYRREAGLRPAMFDAAGYIVEEQGRGRQWTMRQAASSRSMDVDGGGGRGRTHPRGVGPGPATEDAADSIV